MEGIKNEELTSKKAKIKHRLKGKYPDIDVENEEVLYSKIDDDFDAFDSELEAYKSREKTFSDMFTSDPRSATFLMSWKNGGAPVVELVRQFGTDGLKEMIDDPEKLEEIAQANREYLDKVAESKAFEEEYKQNLAASLEAIGKVEGDDAEIDEAITWLFKVGRDASKGIVNPEDLRLAIKAMTFDRATADAEYQGEVRGRNAKIEEKMRSAEGDGMPQLGSRTIPVRENRRANSIFDLAEGAR